MARTKGFKLEFKEDHYLDLTLGNETMVTENYNYARILQRVNREYTKPSVGISNLLLYILSSAMWSSNNVKEGETFIVDGKAVAFRDNQFEVQIKPHIVAGIMGITTKSVPSELQVTKLSDKQVYAQFQEVKKIQGVSVELCKVTKKDGEKLVKDIVSHIVFPSIRAYENEEGEYIYSFTINNAVMDLLLDNTGGWGMMNVIEHFCLPVSAKPLHIFMCRNMNLIKNQHYTFNATGTREYLGHNISEVIESLELQGYSETHNAIKRIQREVDNINNTLGTTLAFEKIYDKNDERKIKRLRFYFKEGK